MSQMSMIQAINSAHDLMMDKDPSVVVLGQDVGFTLYHLVRRQTALVLPQAHGATGDHAAHTGGGKCVSLYVYGLFQAFGKQVVVVGGRSAAGQ